MIERRGRRLGGKAFRMGAGVTPVKENRRKDD